MTCSSAAWAEWRITVANPTARPSVMATTVGCLSETRRYSRLASDIPNQCGTVARTSAQMSPAPFSSQTSFTLPLSQSVPAELSSEGARVSLPASPVGGTGAAVGPRWA